MKTLKGWTESGVDFDKYVTEPCEVSEELRDDLMYYVGSINDFENGLSQVDEAEDSDENGDLRYSTFAERDGKIYYLGLFVSCDENDISDCLGIIDSICG